MRRFPALLALFVLAGCASPGTEPPAGPASDAFSARAQQVADAWRANAAAGAWKTGFVPLEDLTVLTGEPGFTEQTKEAFGNGWFKSSIMFATVVPPKGRIRFADGSTLPVPVIPGGNAFAQLRTGDPPPCGAFGSAVPFATGGPISTNDPNGSTGHAASTACTPLTVTAARLGEVDLRTSRGEAKVPAWIFTVAELKADVARVAVAPDAITPVPSDAAIPPLPANSGLAGAYDLVKADGTTLTYNLGVGACDYDIQPVFAEFDDVVVVAGTLKASPGPCIDLLKLQPVTVTLARPIGGRVVLDLNAHPLQQRVVPR
jgi:hypothetical protein